MVIEARCSNQDCGRAFRLKDEAAGKKIKCSQCGTVITVPAAAGQQAARPKQEASRPHPARQVCTNCGTVLGVRAMICPGCGGDVRTGVTQIRITAEEKRKAGIPVHIPLAQGRRTGRGRLAIGAVLVLVIVGVALAGVWLARNWGSLRSDGAPEKVEAPEMAAP